MSGVDEEKEESKQPVNGQEKITMIVSTIPALQINASMQSGQIMSSNDYINQ